MMTKKQLEKEVACVMAALDKQFGLLNYDERKEAVRSALIRTYIEGTDDRDDSEDIVEKLGGNPRFCL